MQNFIFYLNSLKNNLRYNNKALNRNYLLAKLKLKIKTEIKRQGNIPINKERFIALAMRIKNYFNKSNKNYIRDNNLIN